ncbi:MAG: hypothetical protein QNJ71_04175 [Acidimicrobiia bacterium]|nr:hypothetical protein [Acidimicrobiia bacterium]
MTAYRSPLRLFVFGLLGLVLIVASIDVMFGHWISTEPQNTDGVLTTRGQAQQRGDIVWGAVLVGTGTLLLVGGIVELVRRQPQCRVANEGIHLPMGRHEEEVVIPWGDIRSVRLDVDDDEFDGKRRQHLVIEVDDPGRLPEHPHNAMWVGRELHVDGYAWTVDVGEIALAAQGALAHHRRMEEITQMEPPSLTWRTTVAAGAAPATEVDTAESTEATDPPEPHPEESADPSQDEQTSAGEPPIAAEAPEEESMPDDDQGDGA